MQSLIHVQGLVFRRPSRNGVNPSGFTLNNLMDGKHPYVRIPMNHTSEGISSLLTSFAVKSYFESFSSFKEVAACSTFRHLKAG